MGDAMHFAMFCCSVQLRFRWLQAHLTVWRRNRCVIGQRRRYRSPGGRWLGCYRCLPVDCTRRQISERRPILLQLILPLLRRGECEFLLEPLLAHKLNDAIDLVAQFFIGNLLTSDQVRQIVAGSDNRQCRNDQRN
jgi:hypothetical protein